MLSLIHFSNISTFSAVGQVFVKLVLISETLFFHIQALNGFQTAVSFLARVYAEDLILTYKRLHPFTPLLEDPDVKKP